MAFVLTLILALSLSEFTNSWIQCFGRHLSGLVLPLFRFPGNIDDISSHHHRRPLRVHLRPNERHSSRNDAFPFRA